MFVQIMKCSAKYTLYFLKLFWFLKHALIGLKLSMYLLAFVCTKIPWTAMFFKILRLITYANKSISRDKQAVENVFLLQGKFKPNLFEFSICKWCRVCQTSHAADIVNFECVWGRGELEKNSPLLCAQSKMLIVAKGIHGKF